MSCRVRTSCVLKRGVRNQRLDSECYVSAGTIIMGRGEMSILGSFGSAKVRSSRVGPWNDNCKGRGVRKAWTRD